MAKIEHITAREVLDSRGTPTVQAAVSCVGGYTGSAMVPSGASTGVHEAHELRDKEEQRYGGKGVQVAVNNVKGEIHAALFGKDTGNQNKIDRIMLELDGTVNKSRLGANAILAVSLACARAEAYAQGLPLYLYLQQLFPKRDFVMPVPQMNLINGGRHASNGLSIQEYHILPIASASFAEALRMGTEIYHALQDILRQEGYQVEVGDEGGFAPKLDKSEMAFTLLVRAIETAGYIPGVDVYLGIDAAASEFFDSEHANYSLDGTPIASHDLAHTYKVWRERYPLISIEDPFDQDAWSDWKRFMKHNGDALQIVGDDIYVTNSTRIQQGIVEGVSNAVLINLTRLAR
jgi:enolase